MRRNKNLKTVLIDLPNELHTNPHLRRNDVETQINMLEQELLCNFKNYTITISQDSYLQSTHILINFASIADATLFRLQRYN